MASASATRSERERDRERGRVRLVIVANLIAVREGLANVMAELRAGGEHGDTLIRAEMVLAEVLNNIAEHAYLAAPGLIEITFLRQRDRLDFVIFDEGRPMPEGRLPAAVLPAGEALAEGGYGWFLIHSEARALAYRREGGRNRLSFHLPR